MNKLEKTIRREKGGLERVPKRPVSKREEQGIRENNWRSRVPG